MSTTRYLSAIVPVYNEADNLLELHSRLKSALDSIGESYEIVYVNDGSVDNSFEILKGIYLRDQNVVRVIDFKGNFGQHMAVAAGFENARASDVVITIDADLQNPPEEIKTLLSKIKKGYDFVSGVRGNRRDNFFRKKASALKRFIIGKITKIKMSDDGCMLIAYSRQIVDLIVATKEANLYIPALAYSYAKNPTEVVVQHAKRKCGKSKYRLYDLMRLYFNLVTGYSLLPLQIFTVFGFCVSIFSILFFIFLFIRRLIIGPEAQGLFTLFAIMFFLIGVVLIGLGITGEYIGRIYQEVRKRPRFIINKIFEE